MKNQKIKTIGLGLLLGAAMVSCGHKDNDEIEDQEQQTKIESEQKAHNDAMRKEQEERNRVYEYKEHIKDSIVRTNGFPEGFATFWQNREALEDSIKSLEYKNGPMYAMETAVFNAGNKIAKTYTSILESKLKIYNLPFDKTLINEAMSDDSFIMYGAYKDARESDQNVSDWEIDYAVEVIVKSLKLDETNYGESRKQEISTLVKGTIIEMCKEMYKSRKAIEQQYAKYFAGGMNAINKGCVQYGEGDCWAGYCDWELNNSALVTEKTLWLYDSKLPVDFFADTDADYTVEDMGVGQWRIVKKAKDGKTSRTQTFSHNTDYEITTRPVWNEEIVPSVGKKSFRATPGDNIGMHINYSEVIAVTKPKAKFVGSPELNRKIRELKIEKERVDAHYDELCRIESYADSIACQMSQMWAAQKANAK